jgi:DNA-directed RNA polymerase subunit RPC12/RpoP
VLIKCSECSKEVSDKATACPHCGAPIAAQPVPVSAPQERPVHVQVVKEKSNTWKWVIGVPVGLVIAFLIFGALIPENVARANRIRRICESELMPKGQATQYDCDKAYSDAKYAK